MGLLECGGQDEGLRQRPDGQGWQGWALRAGLAAGQGHGSSPGPQPRLARLPASDLGLEEEG